jgi:hypothetical protein
MRMTVIPRAYPSWPAMVAAMGAGRQAGSAPDAGFHKLVGISVADAKGLCPILPGNTGTAMDILLLVLTVGLPLLKFVLFPARAMGRGGSWTIVGAVMIVGLMMALWFGIQSLSDTATTLGAASAVAAKPGDPPAGMPDLDGLAQFL